MAKSVSEAFDVYLGWLTPTASDRSKASSHRVSIESKLEDTFGLYRMYESGSWKHGTGVRGYSDVDYFVSLKSSKPVYGSSALTSVNAAVSRASKRAANAKRLDQAHQNASMYNSLSAIFGIAAVACAIIPGAEELAPIFLVASVATGAAAASETCNAEGYSQDCQMDIGMTVAGAFFGGAGAAVGSMIPETATGAGKFFATGGLGGALGPINTGVSWLMGNQGR